MNCHHFSTINSSMLSLSDSVIAVIAVCNFKNLYNQIAADFFFNIVNQKRVFFLCSIYLFNSINNLLQKHRKNGRSETQEIDTERKNRVLSVLSCYQIAIAGVKKHE